MSVNVKDQIAAMSKSLEGIETVATDTPMTDAPGTEAPTTEAPITEIPKDDEVITTDVPSTDAPSTDAPTTEAPDDKDETITELRARLEALEKKSKAPKTEAPTTEAPLSVEEIAFIGEDVDLDVLMRDPKEFNKLLNKVYSQGILTGRKVIGEGTLRQIPDIVQNVQRQAAAMQKMAQDFYSANEDLTPFSKVVAPVFEELAAENPDWTSDKMMTEVAKITRERLGLQKKAVENKQQDNKNKGPKLPRKKGGPRGNQEQPSLTKFESELSDMDKALNH